MVGQGRTGGLLRDRAGRGIERRRDADARRARRRALRHQRQQDLHQQRQLRQLLHRLRRDRSRARRIEGISCFIIERDTPGITVSKHFDKLGQRAADTAEITFENVEVPAENRIGEEGQGFMLAMTGLRSLAPRRGGGRGRRGAAGAGREHQVRQRARNLRAADLAASGDWAQDRGHGDQHRGGAAAGLAGGVAGRSRRAQPEACRLSRKPSPPIWR